MKGPQHTERTFTQRACALAAIAATTLSLTACAHVAMMIHGTGARRPAPAEFGLGPRTSAQGRYTATLTPEQQLRPRRMQTMRVTVVDNTGRAVEGAALRIDGGMPQHGHGLPTRPHVTRSLGDGRYEVGGVRFNMGGWWEFEVDITTDGGTDVVTFNLDL
jgi:hypothetical protein